MSPKTKIATALSSEARAMKFAANASYALTALFIVLTGVAGIIAISALHHTATTDSEWLTKSACFWSGMVAMGFVFTLVSALLSHIIDKVVDSVDK